MLVDLKKSRAQQTCSRFETLKSTRSEAQTRAHATVAMITSVGGCSLSVCLSSPGSLSFSGCLLLGLGVHKTTTTIMGRRHSNLVSLSFRGRPAQMPCVVDRLRGRPSWHLDERRAWPGFATVHLAPAADKHPSASRVEDRESRICQARLTCKPPDWAYESLFCLHSKPQPK